MRHLFQCFMLRCFMLRCLKRAVLVLVIPVLITPGATPLSAQVTCRSAAHVVGQILNDEIGWGDLPLEGYHVLDEAALEDGQLLATISMRLDVARLAASRNSRLGTLCVAVVVDAGGEVVVVEQRVVEVPELANRQSLAGVVAWDYHLRLELPEDTGQILALIQEPTLGTWGAFAVDDTREVAPVPNSASVREATPRGVGWYDIVRRDAPSLRAVERRVVVRLIPPRNQPVTGSTRFDAMTTSPSVDRVVFELDGKQMETENRRPYVARLPLAKPARAQTVRAIAYDKNGRVLGEDELVVNELDVPFRVRISGFQQSPGAFDISAKVSVPPESELDRVELYLNEALVRDLPVPPTSGASGSRRSGGQILPFEGRVETDRAGPEDYIRVAAFLKDGSSIDDVMLLASPGLVEEVDVNLVELYAVVSDKDRRPVADLTHDEFTVVLRGKTREIESFAYAADVSLLMGLVVDTSGSMQLVMHDTKKAAAKFIGQTVLPKDRAFVVDFAQKPRLRQDTTGDITDLMLSLGQLEANGATAMYDAIVFSMLQFDKERGRKALVVLTDGDDHESRYGPKDCVDLGQDGGVPIYIIGLGALDSFQRSYRTNDLKKVTSETGGRLYFVESLEELQWAYAEINAELRSQYALTFYADTDLNNEDRRKVKVEMKRRDLKARTVLGSSRRN